MSEQPDLHEQSKLKIEQNQLDLDRRKLELEEEKIKLEVNKLDLERQKAFVTDFSAAREGVIADMRQWMAFAIRTLILVNAGAIVAMLALLGNLAGKRATFAAPLATAVANTIFPFVAAVTSAILAALANYYLHQVDSKRLPMTGERVKILQGKQPDLEKINDEQVNCWARIWRALTAIFTFLSLVLFLWGAWTGTNSMSRALVPPPPQQQQQPSAPPNTPTTTPRQNQG